MDNFKAFDAYRISCWISGGVINAFENGVAQMKTGAVKGAAVVAVVASACFSTFSYGNYLNTAVASPVLKRPSESVVDARMTRLRADIDHQIAAFGTGDTSYLDPSIMELARATIASITNRNGSSF